MHIDPLIEGEDVEMISPTQWKSILGKCLGITVAIPGDFWPNQVCLIQRNASPKVYAKFGGHKSIGWDVGCRDI